MNYMVTMLAIMSTAIVIIGGLMRGKRDSFLWRKLVLVQVIVLVGVVVGMLPLNTSSTEDADNGVDVMFLVDITYSMNAKDGRAGKLRMDDVRSDIPIYVESLGASRIAIGTFSDTFLIALPFTHNLADIDIAAATVDPGLQSSNLIQLSLSESLKRTKVYLETVGKQDTSRRRILVIMSDGELHNKTDSIEDVIAAAKDLRIAIDYAVVIGYGTETGATLANFGIDYSTGKIVENDFKIYASVNGQYQEVVSKRNDENLARLAESLGGTELDSSNITDNSTFVAGLQRSAANDSAKSPEQLAIKQNTLHVPVAIASIALLFLLEVVRLPILRRLVALSWLRKGGKHA